MTDDMVQVQKPDSPYHGRRGAVVDCLAGNRYVVEFEQRDGLMARYSTETFDGRNLKALITVRA